METDMGFTVINIGANADHMPEVHVHFDPAIGGWVTLGFDQRLLSLRISMEQARDLHSKLGSMLYDQEMASIEAARADGAEAHREEMIWREHDREAF
jgi:hypothetical protein